MALNKGPVMAATRATKQLKYYKGGVYDGLGCKRGDQVNHCVLIVGYNIEHKPPYFIVKNTWGSDWGEKGYYRLKMGRLSFKKGGYCKTIVNDFNTLVYTKNG